MGQKIAIVDDNRSLCESLSIALGEEGFETDTYINGEQALQGIRTRPVDLAILDILMPRVNGFDVLRQLRKASAIPVIFLTSKCDDVDETSGLDSGADDYIRKPFKLSILISRIRSLLRRQVLDQGEETKQLLQDDLKIDLERYQCTWKDIQVPKLTVTEFEILKLLVKRPGVVRTRDQIIDLVYGEGFAVSDRTIDSHKKRIVKKFKEVDPEFSQLEAVYRIGYKWIPGRALTN